jgi:hypothetical protein
MRIGTADATRVDGELEPMLLHCCNNIFEPRLEGQDFSPFER